MPTINEYEPTELEALQTAHEAVLFAIKETVSYGNDAPAEKAYHRRLLDSAYWLRNRLGVLREKNT